MLILSKLKCQMFKKAACLFAPLFKFRNFFNSFPVS
jgi:hypothetical protein